MRRLPITLFICLVLLMPVSLPTTGAELTSTTPSDETSEGIPFVYAQDLIEEIYFSPLTNRIEDYVEEFTENGSRYIIEYSMADTGANMYARNYLVQMFDSLSNGRIETQIIGDYKNVVARLPGYLPGDNPVFVLSAHYDSAQSSPGANCDGSGIAVLLELADIMSQYRWPLDIYFIAFNGLFGMYPRGGSPEVSNWFVVNEIDILMLYNVDTILVPNPYIAFEERIQIGYDVSSPYHKSNYWADLARTISNNDGANLIVPVPSDSFYLWSSSDHYSFYESGISSVSCFFQSGIAFDDAYHSPADTYNNNLYRYYLAREVAGVIGASMAFTMGREYGEVTRQTREFILGRMSFMRTYVPITTPTAISVDCRWFGGPSSFSLLGPDLTVIRSVQFDHTSAWEPTHLFTVSVLQPGLYTILAENTHDASVGYDLSYSYDSDIDGNGVLDSQEYWLNPALWNSDQDGDSVSDADEIVRGMDLNNPDSDDDTMPDNYELENGLDPLNPSDANGDADNDGLTNSQEYQGGMNPFSEDSDDDGMPDLWEVENGLDPLANDADEDPDSDGYTNLEEYKRGTDPLVANAEEFPIGWLLLIPPVAIAPIAAFVYIRSRAVDE